MATKWRRRAVVLIVTAPLLILAADWSWEFIAVDSCLDRGGVYDYQRGTCITDEDGPRTLPVISYYSRRRALVLGSVSASVLLLLGVVGYRLWRRRGGS